VSRQAIYLHFKSKAGLLFALVDHVDSVEGLPGRLAKLGRATSGRALLDACVSHAAEYTPLIYRIATAFDSARRTDTAADAAWQSRMSQRRAGTEMICRRLGSEGLLNPGWSVGAAADFLWVMTSIRVWEDLVMVRGWTRGQYVRYLRSSLRASLVRRTSRNAPHSPLPGATATLRPGRERSH
jgi:AcrR family transcriptional regulator